MRPCASGSCSSAPPMIRRRKARAAGEGLGRRANFSSSSIQSAHGYATRQPSYVVIMKRGEAASPSGPFNPRAARLSRYSGGSMMRPFASRLREERPRKYILQTTSYHFFPQSSKNCLVSRLARQLIRASIIRRGRVCRSSQSLCGMQ